MNDANMEKLIIYSIRVFGYLIFIGICFLFSYGMNYFSGETVSYWMSLLLAGALFGSYMSDK